MLLTALACGASTLCLRAAWQARVPYRTAWQLGSLTNAGVACRLIQPDYGAAAGVAIVLFAISLGGLALTFVTVERQKQKTGDRLRQPQRRDTETGIWSGWRGWARGLAALLLTLLATEASCAALAVLLPGSGALGFAFGMIVAPFLWASLLVWVVTDRSLTRPVLGMTGVIAVAMVPISVGLLL